MCNHKWKTTQGIFQTWKDCEICGMKFEDYLKQGEKKIYALGGLKPETFTAPSSGYYEVSGTVFAHTLKYKDAVDIVKLAKYYATEERYSNFEQACSIEFDNAIGSMSKSLERQLHCGTGAYIITKEDK